jgi:ribonuclease P protein component
VGANNPDGRKRLPRTRRLTRGPDILAVLRRGKKSGTAHLDVYHSFSPVSHLRVGWIVPKLGHNSVQRNLVKRRIREILRQDICPMLMQESISADVLVRARKSTYGTAYAELRGELVAWAEKLCSRVS